MILNLKKNQQDYKHLIIKICVTVVIDYDINYTEVNRK